MSSQDAWQNPITAQPGQLQPDIDPASLRPPRSDLIRSRLEFQRNLIRTNKTRYTPIQVSQDGVIIDGHHYARAAAEEGQLVEALVSGLFAAPVASSVLELPLR